MRNVSTLTAHEGEAASQSLSSLFYLDSSACRWLLQAHSPYRAHRVRLQLGHGGFELGPPDDTAAEWPAGFAIVIKSQQTDWETSVDPSRLTQGRLSIPWSEHLNWFFDDFIAAFPRQRPCTRVSEALEDPPPPSLASGRFPESLWIEENFEAVCEAFAGLWIAVEGSSVIAMGHTELEALRQAARVGHDSPYTFHVSREDEPSPMA